MADQPQLDLLLQGVDAWNAWREQHPGIRPDLSGADLTGADLRGTNLGGANLHLADLSEADLRGTILLATDLHGANLLEADITKADLTQANLSFANLSYANLSFANLSDANLGYANLNDANLVGADLSDASIARTIFADVDLRMVKGLETVIHDGPSTIGTDTLLRSQGDIPETFLRDAGLTDTFINSVRSLTQNPLEYSTCFISYSSKDREFVEKLHTDLIAKNVQCWYAHKDLKIGDEFRNRIHEAIGHYDKLVIILSRHSIQSDWVKTEVEAAFEKEQRQNKLALFPIKLDESIKQTTQAWAVDIRLRRHIGDFSCWKEHDAYQRSLKRLLRDLQADTPSTSKP